MSFNLSVSLVALMFSCMSVALTLAIRSDFLQKKPKEKLKEDRVIGSFVVAAFFIAFVIAVDLIISAVNFIKGFFA